MKKTFWLLIILSSIFCFNGCSTSINYFDKNHMYRTRDGSVLLTIDDGPGEHTAQILDILKTNNLKAAFFIIGEKAAQHPELVDRIVAEGHILGNHTYNHIRLLQTTLENAKQQVIKTQEIVSKYTTLRWFRPPFGELSYDMSEWLNDQNYIIVRWSGNWDDIKPGDIMLMHEQDSIDSIRERIVKVKAINSTLDF